MLNGLPIPDPIPAPTPTVKEAVSLPPKDGPVLPQPKVWLPSKVEREHRGRVEVILKDINTCLKAVEGHLGEIPRIQEVIKERLQELHMFQSAVEDRLDELAKLPEVIEDLTRHLAVLIETAEMDHMTEMNGMAQDEPEWEMDVNPDEPASASGDGSPSRSNLDNQTAGLNVLADHVVEPRGAEEPAADAGPTSGIASEDANGQIAGDKQSPVVEVPAGVELPAGVEVPDKVEVPPETTETAIPQ
jgi:hypothetical protein